MIMQHVQTYYIYIYICWIYIYIMWLLVVNLIYDPRSRFSRNCCGARALAGMSPGQVEVGNHVLDPCVCFIRIVF